MDSLVLAKSTIKKFEVKLSILEKKLKILLSIYTIVYKKKVRNIHTLKKVRILLSLL